MLITCDMYQHDERVRELANRLMWEAGLIPPEVFEIQCDEGAVVISRYKVASVYERPDGRLVFTWELDGEGSVKVRRTINVGHGWVDEDGPGESIPTHPFR